MQGGVAGFGARRKGDLLAGQIASVLAGAVVIYDGIRVYAAALDKVERRGELRGLRRLLFGVLPDEVEQERTPVHLRHERVLAAVEFDGGWIEVRRDQHGDAHILVWECALLRRGQSAVRLQGFAHDNEEALP